MFVYLFNTTFNPHLNLQYSSWILRSFMWFTHTVAAYPLSPCAQIYKITPVTRIV